MAALSQVRVMAPFSREAFSPAAYPLVGAGSAAVPSSVRVKVHSPATWPLRE